ncbi:uncharacterized protein LOC121421888 [Lytechinus variegatus]|uniref:uncharacterized protein LOC121421888 n=1 Tax=Lytechinus variegatus TaxID=7654 RepID=UPI001BB22424|nr:uncharacterized protein LOC121421888 [Lytechinus variegatus]
MSYLRRWFLILNFKRLGKLVSKMASFFLALIVFGFAAQANAWPFRGNIPGDDEDGYGVDLSLSSVCHQAFVENENKYEESFVHFMLEVICPSLLDDDDEGSGEGSGHGLAWLATHGNGLRILGFEDIVRALSTDPATQQYLRDTAEHICGPEHFVHPGIEAFCHFREVGIKINFLGGGSGDGSGEGGTYSSSYSSDDGYGYSMFSSSYV